MAKEWSQEQERVNSVIREIQRQMKSLLGSVKRVKSEVIDIRKKFWEDVTVNLEEPDDIIETYASIKQQSEFLSERERGFSQANQRVKTLQKLERSPYFGRIDLQEEDETKSSPIYIGMASLLNQEEDDFLIYDWRAPISSIYYDYSPGSVSYETPAGTIHGEMELKRQYIIKNGKIEGMFDTGITIGDELLQEVLGNQADTQMKSIVATIQKEQNQIIRNERSRVLIVQGVAGSGKTSAALQRVAYLLYRYRETLHADNIILFSPNPLFNSYIATVLPELGEENMQQTTFQEYIESRLAKQFNVEDSFTQLEYVLTAMDEPGYDVRLATIDCKASLTFKELIEDYVTSLSEKGMVFKDIIFRKKPIITAREIEEQFYSIDPTIAIPNRVKLVEEWLRKKIKKITRLQRKEPWVEEQMELLDKEDYLEVHNKVLEEDQFNDLDREQQLLEKLVINRAFKPIYKRIKRLGFLDMKKMYEQLFLIGDQFSIQLPDKWDQICNFTRKKLAQNELFYEDTTPYVYMQDLIEGRKSNTMIRHVFIDEAQDYSPIQFAFMRQLFPNSKMTILGDINQAIHSHTARSSSLYENEWMGEVKKEVIELKKSYRSTRPIVEFTRQLIAGGQWIEPFNRDGRKPLLVQVDNKSQLHASIIQRIHELKSVGHDAIAVICKTTKESIEAYEALKEAIPKLKLIKKETTSYESEPLIIPAYLAKGVEFDAVIIYNASAAIYGRENERKLFYTACTRAMHDLSLFVSGEVTPFLNNVDSDTYINQPLSSE